MEVRVPVPPFDIRCYQSEANDLFRAYTSGDPAAMGRAGILARRGENDCAPLMLALSFG